MSEVNEIAVVLCKKPLDLRQVPYRVVFVEELEDVVGGFHCYVLEEKIVRHFQGFYLFFSCMAPRTYKWGSVEVKDDARHGSQLWAVHRVGRSLAVPRNCPDGGVDASNVDCGAQDEWCAWNYRLKLLFIFEWLIAND